MEKEILEVIAIRHPFPYNDVKAAFKRLKSYDKTIEALEQALTHGWSLSYSVDVMQAEIDGKLFRNQSFFNLEKYKTGWITYKELYPDQSEQEFCNFLNNLTKHKQF